MWSWGGEEGCAGLAPGEPWGTGGARAGQWELRRPFPWGAISQHHFEQAPFHQILDPCPDNLVPQEPQEADVLIMPISR